MDDVMRKGLRVAGMFVFMIGAGVVLESPAVWLGGTIMFLGAGLYVSSLVAKSEPVVLAGKDREES